MLFAVGCALAAGCGSGAHPRTASAATHGAPGAAGSAAAGCLRAPGHRTINGELVDIPRGLARRPPLLVAFHGLGDSPQYWTQLSGFDRIAARNRFVVAYPDARHARRWELNHRDGDADVDFIHAFIRTVVKRVCIDPRRVYLTGFSNGGGFAYRAGCAFASEIAAIAPVSGSYKSHDACPAGTPPMPTLEIHGRDPWTVTVARLVAETKARNHCTRPPVTTQMALGVTRTRWPGCDLERIYNRAIGHQWVRTGAYDTSAEVWRFVSRFRR